MRIAVAGLMAGVALMMAGPAAAQGARGIPEGPPVIAFAVPV